MAQIEATLVSRAFDQLAEKYSHEFALNSIARVNRSRVRELVLQYLPAKKSRVLDFGCGPGDDSLFLANQGHSVVALDVSPAMLSVAKGRLDLPKDADLRFFSGTEREIPNLVADSSLDLILANFGSLNFVNDLGEFAEIAAASLVDDGRIVATIQNRFCLQEFTAYLLDGRPCKATRRWPGYAQIQITGGLEVPTKFYTPAEVRRLFSTFFDCDWVDTIGTITPTSFSSLESNDNLFVLLNSIEHFLSRFGPARMLLSNLSDFHVHVFSKRRI